jgi:hypothetical protein
MSQLRGLFWVPALPQSWNQNSGFCLPVLPSFHQGEGGSEQRSGTHLEDLPMLWRSKGGKKKKKKKEEKEVEQKGGATV